MPSSGKCPITIKDAIKPHKGGLKTYIGKIFVFCKCYQNRRKAKKKATDFPTSNKYKKKN